MTIKTLKQIEKDHIISVLKILKGNKDKTARVLGINPKTLYNRLHKWGLWEKYSLKHPVL